MLNSVMRASSCVELPVVRGRGDRPFTVSLEGNIGSGKSTVLRHFSRFSGVQILEEPLRRWCDVNGTNLLQLLYREPARWSFLFQTYVQLTRLQMHCGDCSESGDDARECQVRIIERSLQNSRHCFVNMSHSVGSLNDAEFQVLSAYHDQLERSRVIDLDLIIYLRTSPQKALQRVRERARPEEDSISLDYLQQLHEWHERWLTGRASENRRCEPPLLVIDADQPLCEVLRQCDLYRSAIIGEQPLQPACPQSDCVSDSR